MKAFATLAAKRLADRPRDFKEARAEWIPLVTPYEVTLEEIKAFHANQGGLTMCDEIIILRMEDFMGIYAAKVDLGKDWWNVDYMECAALIELFMRKNPSSYYSAEKQDYFIFSGAQQAIKEGNKIVICENLS